MGPRERSDSGTFVETVSLEDVLGVFDEVRGPVITSSDVAEQLDCTTEAARQKLTRLYDRGEVDKRKTGRVVVWWHTGGTPPTPAERTGEIETSDNGAEPVDTVPTEEGAETPETLDDAIKAVDTPGSGKNRERREQALRTAYEYLKDHGQAQRKDFKELLGDDVGYASFNSWWTNYVKAKGALKQLPNVDPPGEGEHTWYYAGEDVQTDGEVYDPTEEF